MHDDSEHPLPTARPVDLWQAPPPVLAYARPVTNQDPLDIPLGRWTAVADIGIVLAFFLGAQILAGMLMGAILQNEDHSQMAAAGMVAILAVGFMACGVAWRIHRWRGLPTSSLGFRTSEAGIDILIGIASAIAIMCTIYALNFVLIMSSNHFYNSAMKTKDNIINTIPSMPLWIVPLVTLAVGTYEEVLFRGFVLPRLRTFFGYWGVAAVVGSLVFALFHWYQGMHGMTTVFIMSLGLSIVFIWRKSLLPAIIAHAVINLVPLTMFSLFRDSLETIGESAEAAGAS